MTLADSNYNRWEDNIAPYCKEYAKFWCDLMVSYGFTQVPSNYPKNWWYYTFMYNGEEYNLRINPCGFRGMWISGKSFRKKILTEGGLHKFLKSEKLGVFAK
jgi:hypothetical protein